MSARISATAALARNMARCRAIQSDIVRVRSISRRATIPPMEGWMVNLKLAPQRSGPN